MANPTYFEALKWASSFLSQQHVEDVGAYLLMGRAHWTQTQLLTHYRQAMPATAWTQFQTDIQTFATGQPAQYILGEAPFYGESFQVTPATLIPRPETEELVEWVLHKLPVTPLTVLDLGTGTGAIGLTLKRLRPQWQVTLSDISPEALAVAQKNATQQQLTVNLVQGDLFTPVQGQQFDLIVSNPPYIAPTEKAVMDRSVLEHEPATALFSGTDGLALYRRLLQQLPQYLTAGGQFFGEFGYRQQPALTQLCAQLLPNLQATFRQDINQQPRMLHLQHFEQKEDS
ncbi:peptide chain release factor N(5)-glutamine methyltransferase [Loigolactobacillus bifermentans]|uniref:Release factor glutamine methyltransferase n=1 Tax=Loigolactobacillus bifermentans DSM 20003 TaxID=1423726 RepID=A0A0R1GXF4_9LACO|nr:peptide chain release factor N(5)-glutamine methyltransferase [Loigolactobacillus bifermentans]KRK39035.1 N5-glutamine S-adenosyl-L-methionine-dependent methyltransferase [Loigolactobacillus bifermentans DSM 20003]QGG59076.1 peptide chain release factor N(5)-glutamine methyltransferase [Loigolactobacillus bifermentans]